MRLKPGVDPVRGRQFIDSLRTQLGNISGTEADQARALVDWTQLAETTLRNHFVEVDLEHLYTPRLWRISIGDIELRSYMINHEREVKREWLDQVIAELDKLIRAFGSLASGIVVLDTNVLLHFLPPEQIPWAEVVRRSPVTLVVPIAVVDELDGKKAVANRTLARRASGVIAALRASQGKEIAAGTSLRIVGSVEIGVGRRPVGSIATDLAVLDTCEALAAYAENGSVGLATGDYGMELRANDRGVPVISLDDKYRRNTEAV